MSRPEDTKARLAAGLDGHREALNMAFEAVRPDLEQWVALRMGARLQQRIDIEDVVQETLMVDLHPTNRVTSSNGCAALPTTEFAMPPTG